MSIQVVTGAYFGDKLLPEEQFKKQACENLQNSNFIQLAIAWLRGIAAKRQNKKEFSRAYQEWQQFQKLYLLNKTPISLLVISDFTSDSGQKMKTGSTQATFVEDQSLVLDPSGTLKTNAKAIESLGQKAAQELVSEVLVRHYNNLMQTVNSDIVSKDFETAIRIQTLDYYSPWGNQKLAIRNRYYKNNQNNTYRTVIWGKTQDAQFRGQVADAFFNHLGALHQSMFSSGGIQISKLLANNFNKTVRQEEGTGFLQRLINARNNTHWASGGDINIVDENLNKIASIQLKTVASNTKTTVGSLSRVSFFNMIENLIRALENSDYEVYANTLYQKLQTTAFIKNSANTAAEITNDLINSFQNFG